MAQLKEELLQEDATRISSAAMLPSHVAPAGTFLRKAIEVEDRM